ncbi:hypothetical protein PRZ48_014311 [Zasmidium cellare]|uniref:Apple domain-containing protein n=1 Tax=Zasmidium cellare TaxID=395010 RepID=A0ABR0E0K9_ZASCE|nr:hypothetical protein PRZ48_014311 [Zasmidium cellare]
MPSPVSLQVQTVATATPIIKRVSKTSTSTKVSVVVVPSTSTVTVRATATQNAQGSCPSLGSSYTDSNGGAQYNVFCKNSYARTTDNTISSLSSVASFEACVKKCSSTTGCAAVDYVRANSQCYLLSISTALSKGADTTSDCAANVNPPPAPGSGASLGSSYSPPDSPLSFTIAFGNVYTYPSSSLISSISTSTFQDCVNSCAQSSKCLLAFRSRSDANCLLFNQALPAQSKRLMIRDGTTPTDGDSATLNATALTPCSSLTNPYTAANGDKFNFDCKSINTIGPHYELIMGNDTGRAFSECMDLCSTTANCVAATYFPSTTPGNNYCYLLHDIIFGLDYANNVNSAILTTYQIPPQTCDALAAVGPTLTADSNLTYTLNCGQTFDLSTNYTNSPGRYFKECVFWCSSDPNCMAAEFDSTKGWCYLFNSGTSVLSGSTDRSVAILNNPPPSQSTVTSQTIPPSSTTTLSTLQGSTTTTSTTSQNSQPTAQPTAQGSCASLNGPYTTHGRQFNATCDSWLPLQNNHFISTTPTGGISTFASCLDLCATTPTCRAVDYDETQTTCILFGYPNTLNFTDTLAPKTGGYDFAQLVPADLSCESLNIPYTSSSGPQFELFCDNSPTYGHEDIVNIFEAASFKDCVDWCGDPHQIGCDVASYNGTHCFGLYNNAYSNARSLDVTWDTARMLNPPMGCSGLTSPAQGNASNTYDIECYHNYPANVFFTNVYVSTFQDCINSCEVYPTCAGVIFWLENTPTPACNLFTSPGDGNYRGNAHTALRRTS